MPLTDVQLRQFHEDGFVIVRDFFSARQLQPVIDTTVTGPWLQRWSEETNS